MTVVNFKPEEENSKDMEKNALDLDVSVNSNEHEQLLGRVLAGTQSILFSICVYIIMIEEKIIGFTLSKFVE